MLDCGMGASSTIFERSYRVYDERDRTFPGPGMVSQLLPNTTDGGLLVDSVRVLSRLVKRAKRVNLYPPGIWS